MASKSDAKHRIDNTYNKDELFAWYDRASKRLETYDDLTLIRKPNRC